MVRITCPDCNFSREYQADKIPPQMRSATCPKCGALFELADILDPPAHSLETSPPVEEGGTHSCEHIDLAYSGHPSPPGRGAGVREPLSAEITQPEADIPASPAAYAPAQRRLRFSFSGNGRDYFGIWIVNTMLKIITCGIYSAWAKVRKRRYFYGNTSLDGTPFDYLADPLAIFKGWAIAAVVFILYSVASQVSPILASALSILFFLSMPWLIVRSRIFNLRYSAHRNIRFTFAPNYRDAYLVYAGLPCLLPFTLGLIAPYMIYRQKKFLVENSGYGRTRLSFDARVRDYYLVFVKAFGCALVALAAVGVVGACFSGALHDLSLLLPEEGMEADAEKVGAAALGSLALLLGGMALGYLLVSTYLQTALTNLTWNGTRLRHSRFSSTLGVGRMAWLYLSSAAGIMLSFGLLIPWATIRITRYRMAQLALELRDDQEGFLGWGHRDTNSAGEEIGDMFGIEIGL